MLLHGDTVGIGTCGNANQISNAVRLTGIIGTDGTETAVPGGHNSYVVPAGKSLILTGLSFRVDLTTAANGLSTVVVRAISPAGVLGARLIQAYPTTLGYDSAGAVAQSGIEGRADLTSGVAVGPGVMLCITYSGQGQIGGFADVFVHGYLTADR